MALHSLPKYFPGSAVSGDGRQTQPVLRLEGSWRQGRRPAEVGAETANEGIICGVPAEPVESQDEQEAAGRGLRGWPVSGAVIDEGPGPGRQGQARAS